MKILETPRLVLRTIDPEDAAFYYELVNDPSFLEHIGDKGVRSIEGARTAIIDGPRTMQQLHGHSLYVMERKSDGALLGLCGLVRRESLPGADIGYAIRPAYFGQGYTFEAASAVAAYARDRLGMTSLLGITSPTNTSSINLLQKLGMTMVEFKLLPPDGRPTNIYSMALGAA